MGNGKRQEKLDKYKTPQLVYFVDTVLNYLEKNKDLNPRHLTLLRKCQITLNSNKKRLIGIEVVNIKQCKNLSTSGIYNVKYSDVNSNRINIFGDNYEKIQNPSNRNDQYFDERETNNLKNQIQKQLEEQKLKEIRELNQQLREQQELKEKQLKEQRVKELEELNQQLKKQQELREKQLKEQKVKELEEMLEKLKKEQKAKESKGSNLKKESNLLFN